MNLFGTGTCRVDNSHDKVTIVQDTVNASMGGPGVLPDIGLKKYLTGNDILVESAVLVLVLHEILIGVGRIFFK